MSKIIYSYYTATMRKVQCSGKVINHQGNIVTYINKDGEQVRINIGSPHILDLKLGEKRPC
jgi:hypothetical protein